MVPIRTPGFSDASPGVRAALQDVYGNQQELLSSDEAAALVVAGLTQRVAALEAGGAGRVIRTAIQLSAAQVAALGAAVTGRVELTPPLPAFTSVLNATAHVVVPFVSSVPGYTLQASTFWRAKDSAAPDAVPLDMAPVKTGYTVGSDTAAVSTWEGFGTSASGNPFNAEGTAGRWPYTPTLVVDLSETGAGGATFGAYTDGLLEIVVLSVTMQ